MELSGSPLDYVFVFFGGVLLSFTPCIYPLIPITVGYIGVNAGGSKARGFGLTFIYTTGFALTYALLGLFAALSGKMFGEVASQPWVLILAGAVIIFFGLTMLKVFAVYFPSISRLSHFHKKGFWSILLLGATSGLIVSPCTGPALGAVLLYIATTRNALYGMTLLLTFAYGAGLLIMVVGTFSTVLIHFPKSGKWMIMVEKIAAFILIAFGTILVFTGIMRTL